MSKTYSVVRGDEIMKKSVENAINFRENNILNLVKGICISFITTLLFLFIFSIFLTYTNVQEYTIPPVIILITVISILLGSSISTINIRKNGILNGGVIGGIYIGTLYVISSILQTGFGVNIYSMIMIILALVMGMIGGVVGVNIKK